MMSFLLIGIILGLTAGISPGPLLALVISETLQHGRKEGIKISLVPVIVDLPIILLSVFLLSKISDIKMILSFISFAGAAFLIYLAYESIFYKAKVQEENKAPRSFRKGIIDNIFSPHPYLFWISVGAPILLKAYKISLVSDILFVLAFYSMLVGSKIVTAILVERSKTFLNTGTYLYIIKGLGIVLLVFALIFIKEGLKLLGVF